MFRMYWKVIYLHADTYFWGHMEWDMDRHVWYDFSLTRIIIMSLVWFITWHLQSHEISLTPCKNDPCIFHGTVFFLVNVICSLLCALMIYFFFSLDHEVREYILTAPSYKIKVDFLGESKWFVSISLIGEHNSMEQLLAAYHRRLCCFYCWGDWSCLCQYFSLRDVISLWLNSTYWFDSRGPHPTYC